MPRKKRGESGVAQRGRGAAKQCTVRKPRKHSKREG